MVFGRIAGVLVAGLCFSGTALAQAVRPASTFDIGLAPYTPTRCNAINLVWDRISERHKLSDESVGRHVYWFLGMGPDCLGPPNVPMPSSAEDQKKLAWLRTAAVAYEFCNSTPTQDACKPGGAAHQLLEPLGLAQIPQDLIVRAMGGDLEAINAYAEALVSKHGDRSAANQWWRRAADRGHAKSMLWLASQLELGFPPREEDQADAVRYYKLLAAQGHARGMARLAERYQIGYAVPVDLAQARQWYQRAAAAGDNQAIVALATYLRHGLGGPQDGKAASEWEQKLGASWHPITVEPRSVASMRPLGLSGRHVGLTALPAPVCKAFQGIRVLAFRRFTTSAPFKSDTEAFHLAGCRLSIAFPIVPGKADAEAFEWIREQIIAVLEGTVLPETSTSDAIEACDRAIGSLSDKRLPAHIGGRAIFNFRTAISLCEPVHRSNPEHVRTTFHLGRAYLAGRDLERALPLLNRAAERGYPAAMVELSFLYRDGLGVRQDLSRAGELLEMAATSEPSSPPVSSLLNLFETDRELKHHYRGARPLFEAEAAKGDVRAMFALLKLAESGRAGGKDPAAVRRWLEMIAALGDAKHKSLSLWAMARLGYYHHVGEGGTVNTQLARTWYEKARAGGYASPSLLNNIAALDEAKRAPRRQTGRSGRGDTGTTADSWTGPNTYQPPPANRTIIYECYGCNSLREF